MKKSILVIDDDADILELAKIRLKHAGYDVLTALTAEEGLKILKKQMPDLILLDLLLPGMRGEEFCKIVKKDRKTKKIPVIIFTASVTAISKTMLEISADDYVLKPFDPQELLLKIQKLIS
jgi:DNA-binding response OmpR family regulator